MAQQKNSMQCSLSYIEGEPLIQCIELKENGEGQTAEIACHFSRVPPSRYQCTAPEIIIGSDDVWVSKTTGNHLENQFDSQVNWLFFSKSRRRTMKYLPKNISVFFPNLRVIEAPGCGLTLISSRDLEGLGHLYEIEFKNNDIVTIAENSFDKLFLLDRLTLSFNKIRRLAEKLFENLENLSELSLQGNRIEELDEKIFARNYKLQLLYLNRNKLTYLPRDIFKNNRVLETIDLSKNNLKIIKTEFKAFTTVPHINLKGNVCIDKDFEETSLSLINESIKERCSCFFKVKFARSPNKFAYKNAKCSMDLNNMN